MSIRRVLGEEAHVYADQASAKISHLEKELLQIETRKREIETQLDAAKFAQERLSSFAPERGGHLKCPICWIERGVDSNIRSIGGGTSNEDFFRCDYDHDFSAHA